MTVGNGAILPLSRRSNESPRRLVRPAPCAAAAGGRDLPEKPDPAVAAPYLDARDGVGVAARPSQSELGGERTLETRGGSGMHHLQVVRPVGVREEGGTREAERLEVAERALDLGCELVHAQPAELGMGARVRADRHPCLGQPTEARGIGQRQLRRADALVPVVRAADPSAHGERKRGNAELTQHRQSDVDEVAIAVVEGEEGGAARDARAPQKAAELGRVDEPEPAG